MVEPFSVSSLPSPGDTGLRWQWILIRKPDSITTEVSVSCSHSHLSTKRTLKYRRKGWAYLLPSENSGRPALCLREISSLFPRSFKQMPVIFMGFLYRNGFSFKQENMWLNWVCCIDLYEQGWANPLAHGPKWGSTFDWWGGSVIVGYNLNNMYKNKTNESNQRSCVTSDVCCHLVALTEITVNSM